MADQKITELTAETTPAGTDLVEVVVDPAGTPANRKVTITNLLAVGGSGDTIEDTDGAWSAQATTAADDTADTATATLTATDTATSTAEVTAYADAAPTASVQVIVNGQVVLEAADVGAGALLAFFGGSPAAQPTGDSSAITAAQIWQKLAAIGLVIDTV